MGTHKAPEVFAESRRVTWRSNMKEQGNDDS